MEDDWVAVEGFFLNEAATCFLFSANLVSKLVLTVLAFGSGGVGIFADKEVLEVEEVRELPRVSSFFGPFLL